MTTIGILETGIPPEDLIDRYPRYPKMFEDLLRPHMPEAEFVTYDLLSGPCPTDPKQHDGWLVTGSPAGVYEHPPWMGALVTLIQASVAGRIPLVGVCFGHQVIAHALGGQVQKSDRGWGIGVHDYMTHTGETLRLNAMHQDQVTAPPPDAVTWVSSDFCPHAGLMVGGNGGGVPRVLTLQPHPEFSPDFERDLILQRRGGKIPAKVADMALETLDGLSHIADADQVAAKMAVVFRSACDA